MPEVELRRDPLGANRGKSFREQASILQDRVKTHLHNKYYIPPYRPTNREWEMTFASLGYNRKTIEKFWRLFCQINHSSGAIQLQHFLYHFDLDWTPWTERCFRHFDTTGGGDIDFLEFMITVWNVCTFKIDSLSNFAFDMYDLDSDGELSIPEIEQMIKELFGEGGGKQCLASAIDFAEARGGALNLNSFIAFTGSHQLLLFPIFELQRKLQSKVFGIQFWQNIEHSAKENYNQDQNKTEFNPRHVQILLRTYQVGGAAAVLSHTGDPNKGLRDWYETQKNQDAESGMIDESQEIEQKSSRWNSLRDKVNTTKATHQWSSVRKSILDTDAMGKIKELKPKGVSAKREKSTSKDPDRSTAPSIPSNNDARPTTPNLPRNVANDLKRIRARQAAAHDTIPTSPLPPPTVAEDLKRIRERRTRKANRNRDETKQSDRPRHQRRTRTKSIGPPHQNARQRTAGSMFYKSPDSEQGPSKGWLQS